MRKALVAPIVTEEGSTLNALTYGNVSGAKAAVIINAALGIPQQYYASFAGFLVEHGYFVVTYDYPGNGVKAPSALRKVRRTTVTQWARRDFAAVVEHATRAAPGLPVLCVGHSIGGQLLGLLPQNNRICGLLAVCAQSGFWRLWSGRERLKSAFVFFFALPVLTALFGYYPGSWLGTSNLPAGVAREWARWCRNRHYMTDKKGAPTREGFAGFTGRALFVSTYDDRLFAPRRAVDALCSFHTGARTERLHLEAASVGGKPIGHFGFFRVTVGRALWAHAVQWMDQAAQGGRGEQWNKPAVTA